jgi:hypothetical protein
MINKNILMHLLISCLNPIKKILLLKHNNINKFKLINNKDNKLIDQIHLIKMDLILMSENLYKVLTLKLIIYSTTSKDQPLKCHLKVNLNRIK